LRAKGTSVQCEEEEPATSSARLPPMQHLLSQAKALGFNRQYVQKCILPSWWDDEIATTPAGMAEAMALVARHTGADFESLRAGNTPRFRSAQCLFKRAAGKSDSDLTLSKALGVQLAGFASLGVNTPVSTLPTSGATVRDAIIGEGQPVTLKSLVDYCWRMGVIVLQFSSLPKGAKKMHAMATIANGRPAIVVSHKATDSHLLFDVAHELGHLGLCHIRDGETLVDEKIDEDPRDDEQEAAANTYALCVITGGPARISLREGHRFPNATQLAQAAKEHGNTRNVDAGHIVLNYAHTMIRRGNGNSGAFWGTANAALKQLEVRTEGLLTISEAANKNIQWDALPEDAAEFTRRLVVMP